MFSNRSMLVEFVFLTSIAQGVTSRKIVPSVTRQDFERICSFTPLARQLFESVSAQVLAPEPSSIGFPDAGGMSAYYEGEITKAEVKSVTDFLMAKGYLLQNTHPTPQEVGPWFNIHLRCPDCVRGSGPSIQQGKSVCSSRIPARGHD